jgi:serine protease AprX
MFLSTTRYVVAAFVLAGSPFLVDTAWAQANVVALPKLDESLTASVRKGDSDWKRVIIQTTGEEVPAMAALLYTKGNIVGRVHPSINALTAIVPVGELEGLAKLASVKSISIDADVTAHQTATSTYTLRATLGLPVQSPTANRIHVAVIDSGLEPGREFDDRIARFYDFTQDGKSDTPTDPYGHGTHVAGLIAGEGDAQKQYRGVAPKARLIVLKVLDENGTGSTSDVISAIEFVTENRESLEVDVINLSLGHPIFEPAATDPLVQAVEAAVRAGIVVVVAAGNHGIAPETGEPGYGGIVSPANAPSAIAVGATKTFDSTVRSDDRVAAYSSRGPSWYDGFAKPDLVAPGHGLVSVAALEGSLYLNNPGL